MFASISKRNESSKTVSGNSADYSPSTDYNFGVFSHHRQ